MKSYPQRTPQQLADQIELACEEFNTTYPATGRKDKRTYTDAKRDYLKKIARKHQVTLDILMVILLQDQKTNTKRGKGYFTQEHRITAKQA